MGVKEGFFSMLLMGLSASVLANKCPAMQNIRDCNCHNRGGRDTVEMTCFGDYSPSLTIEYYREILQKYFPKNTKVEFTFKDINYKTSSLPSRMFDGLHVKSLKFERCKVSRWADEEGGPAFIGLEDTLEKIELKNTINKRERDVRDPMSLGHLRKLKVVNFHNNKLLKFGDKWFGAGGYSVESLILEDNGISEIGRKAFAGLAHLKTIDLKLNSLTTLTRSMFPNPAKDLKKMDLSINKITYFPEDMFTNMPLLNWIKLYSNDIQQLPEKTWRPIWSRLYFLDLENNPLKCDDHIEWIFEVKQPTHLDGECRTPEEMYEKSLKEMIDEKKGIIRANEYRKFPFRI